MRGNLKVRPIEIGDLYALLELCREHAEYEKANFLENGQVERWRTALFADRPTLHGWIATDGNQPCGFMTVTVDYATWGAKSFAHMDCLYLQEPYRRQGLGRAFLERLREFAVANHCGWAEWQTPADNEIGVSFYRRAGASGKSKLRFRYDVHERSIT